MSSTMHFLVPDSSVLPLAEPLLDGIDGVLEGAAVDGSGFVFCDFSPTHSPNPSLAPPGERGEPHVAACLKVGNLANHRMLASKWPQHRHEALKLDSALLQLVSNWPQRIDGLCKSISTPHQRALKCLQQIENPLTPFDGNAPLRTFFPSKKTRPHVAVDSLSAPAGVERVGERGGIQRIKNKKAADNRSCISNSETACVKKILQKQEHATHMGRGLEARKLQNMLAIAQLVAASRELAQ